MKNKPIIDNNEENEKYLEKKSDKNEPNEEILTKEEKIY